LPTHRTTLLPYTTLFRSLEEMETQEKDLEQRVRTAKNEWLVQTSNPNMPLLQKAIQAGYMGLAGEALKTLENASVPELTRVFKADRKSTRLNSSHGSISY